MQINMTSNRKLRVFLCHASQDKPVARELYQRLSAEGWIDPWLDTQKLLPGHDWRREIEEAVEAADNVIVFLSKNSISKEGYVQKEMKYAQEISLEKPEGTIFIIPLKLEECEVPRRMSDYQWTDYFGDNKEQGYKDLINSLRLRLDEKIQKENKEKTSAETEAQNKTIGFHNFLLNPNIKVKDYMHPDTFDGYKVSLQYRVLETDDSEQMAGILHFSVAKTVGEIVSELLRLQKVKENVMYDIEVKASLNENKVGVLIEKGSEIFLRPNKLLPTRSDDANHDELKFEGETLTRARVNLRDGHIKVALDDYSKLIRLGILLDVTVSDLKIASQQYSDEPYLWGTLGDAYGKIGRDQDASNANDTARKFTSPEPKRDWQFPYS
jgi:hypothetical protein